MPNMRNLWNCRTHLKTEELEASVLARQTEMTDKMVEKSMNIP